MAFTFTIPQTLSIKIYQLQNQNFLVFSNKNFFLIPTDCEVLLENNKLILQNTNVKYFLVFSQFLTGVSRLLKRNELPFVKKLIFKGLGLKASLIQNDILELKLGFSHLIKVKIPLNKIWVKLIKNGLLIFSLDLVLVTNFMYKIKSLKLPNIYKGKGIWYKNETLSLKEIKKN